LNQINPIAIDEPRPTGERSLAADGDVRNDSDLTARRSSAF
jgi:hypothetical protein